jgi:beta-glucosidase
VAPVCLVAIDAPDGVVAGDEVPVTVRLRNTGTRHGRQVVQLYASRPDSSVPRPVRWLVGFASVDAQAGQDITATIAVPGRALANWNVTERGWTVEPGAFGLSAGASCQALFVTTELTIARGVNL